MTSEILNTVKLMKKSSQNGTFRQLVSKRASLTLFLQNSSEWPKMSRFGGKRLQKVQI